MAKNHRPSGSGGMKIARNAQSGRYTEVTGVRGHPSTSVLTLTGSKGVTREVFHNERVIRSVKGFKMVEAVMHAAADEGLTVGKDGRIAGRVSSELIAKAKAKTGISSDTELLEFALATVAVEDHFAEAFHSVRGTIDPDIDLGS